MVAALLVAALLAFRTFAHQRADADLKAALAAGSGAAAHVDHDALWQAESERFRGDDPSGTAPDTPTLPRSHLIDRRIEPARAVLIYQIAEWGEYRCFELVATADDAYAAPTSCPGSPPTGETGQPSRRYPSAQVPGFAAGGAVQL
jgi:hypothetical protein